MPALQLAHFSSDVTCPIGHPCMGGGIPVAQKIEDPLLARGFVLLGKVDPIVVVAVDWCEIRNEAFELWRSRLAEAAHTVPARVIVASIHQHDAPIADFEAQRLLEKHSSPGAICQIDFVASAIDRVARAVTQALKSPQPVTHLGLGQARVERIASNRRWIGPDGKPQFGRGSFVSDVQAREAPEGTIDPFLKTISFWNDKRPVAALSCYATHPMSVYGRGLVSSDFVGLARARRQSDDNSIFQVYASGCSGNVTAGKYNDGGPGHRASLTTRLYDGLVAAWKATKPYPLDSVDFRVVPLRLEPRNSAGFNVDDLELQLAAESKRKSGFDHCLAALGLSWRRRGARNATIDVPCLDFGPAQIAQLPGESYVEYQLAAQEMRRDSLVMTLGYGECATGYVPTEGHFDEADGNLADWCWIAPGCERPTRDALKAALGE
jgi:hypothetical protein